MKVAYRRIDDLGRVVIPKAIRKESGIYEGDVIEIMLNDNNEIVLSCRSDLNKDYELPIGIVQERRL